MRKRSISAFLYYTMEMVIFLLVLFVLYTIIRVPFPMMEHVRWLVFVFVLAIPLDFLKDEQKKLGLGMYLILIILSGVFIWKFAFLALAVLVGVPFWRIATLLRISIQPALLINRFILSTGIILFCYFFVLANVNIDKMDTSVLKDSLPFFMWGQFLLLIVGLTWINYINMNQLTGVSLKRWLKHQSFTALIAVGMVVLVIGCFFLLPVLQFIVFETPGIMFELLAYEKMFLFIHDLIEWLRWEREISDYEAIGNMDECEDCAENKPLYTGSKDSKWVQNLFQQVFQIGVLLAVGFLIYFILKRIYSMPEKQTEKFKEQRYVTEIESNNKEKRVKWAKDEVRKLYQSLLIHIRKREETFENSRTAREWSHRFSEGHPDLWKRITHLYEQKRYSSTPLTSQDIKDFKIEIKKAKKETNRYFANLKKEGRWRVKRKT
jgi:hypothetical protein